MATAGEAVVMARPHACPMQVLWEQAGRPACRQAWQGLHLGSQHALARGATPPCGSIKLQCPPTHLPCTRTGRGAPGRASPLGPPPPSCRLRAQGMGMPCMEAELGEVPGACVRMCSTGWPSTSSREQAAAQAG